MEYVPGNRVPLKLGEFWENQLYMEKVFNRVQFELKNPKISIWKKFLKLINKYI